MVGFKKGSFPMLDFVFLKGETALVRRNSAIEQLQLQDVPYNDELITALLSKCAISGDGAYWLYNHFLLDQPCRIAIIPSSQQFRDAMLADEPDVGLMIEQWEARMASQVT